MGSSVCAQIIFNPKWPSDWKERLASHNDAGMNERREAWYWERNHELKEQKLQAMRDYWKKRRLELGYKNKEK